MTNYEWLIRTNRELVKGILSRHISKEKGIPDRCSETYCRDCDFRCGDCNERSKEWLEREHDPLYKKGDIVINRYNQINIITEDYYDGGFISMSQYSDSIVGRRVPITDIKKKVGHIEESEGK